MSLSKVIERKNTLAGEQIKARMKKDTVLLAFRAFVNSQESELKNLFPTVIIGENHNDILGISYSSSVINGRPYMGNTTQNIVLDSLNARFNIGYGANTAGGRKQIPFSYDVNKTQLKKVFKQVLETLVSMTYSVHSEKAWHIQQEVSFYHNSHKKVLRSDLNTRFMQNNAEMFQRGGTHDYYKMNGKLFVDAHGRKIFEFVSRG